MLCLEVAHCCNIHEILMFYNGYSLSIKQPARCFLICELDDSRASQQWVEAVAAKALSPDMQDGSILLICKMVRFESALFPSTPTPSVYNAASALSPAMQVARLEMFLNT